MEPNDFIFTLKNDKTEGGFLILEIERPQPSPFGGRLTREQAVQLRDALTKTLGDAPK